MNSEFKKTIIAAALILAHLLSYSGNSPDIPPDKSPESNSHAEVREIRIEELNKEADYYLNKSMPDNALPLLFDLLKLYKKGSEPYDNAQIKIAEAYRQKREYKKGIELLYSVIKENKSSQSKVEVYAYTRLAALYSERPKSGLYRDSVIKFSKLALDIAIENGYENFIASSSNELGYVYRIKGDYNQALPLLLEARSIYESLGKSEHAAGVVLNISSVYFDQGNPKKALQILDEAIQHFNMETDYNILMRLYIHKASILEQTGNYKEAYAFLKQSRLLQKRFFVDRIDKHILDLSARYDLELKEAKLVEERMLREQKERNIRVLLILIILLMFLTVSVYFVFRLKRKTLEQKEQVSSLENKILKSNFEQKTKELNNAIASSIAIEKVLRKLSKELKADNTQGAIEIINSNINSDNKWQEFIYNFNKIYPDFFIKFQKKHPELSDNEIRLSAMLKMNLKSKEIANTLNIAISSVHKARQRLRKKLNLTSYSDISDYLNSL